jgi:carbon-monoxide dehydrogenase medium subunit/6-hydroxypseudooxynicotine dehydrogenase subunit alpha
MKPPAFVYEVPETLDGALAPLAEHGDDAKILAGGQSLIPLLNFRLARPAVLVDINRIESLQDIQVKPGAGLTLGAVTRQAAVEHSADVGREAPLLLEAIRYVAHPQIRHRGTVGGSVAHADPAAELPVALTALEAEFVACSREGERRISAADLFVSHLTTSLRDDEVLVSIEVPAQPRGTGAAFAEFARRSGDYALGGAAALITRDEGGRCARARIALLAAGDVPLRARAAEADIAGHDLNTDTAAAAAAAAVKDIDPIADQHGDSAYRRAVVEAMCAEAILAAAARAKDGEG